MIMVKRRRSCSAFKATVFYSIPRVSTHVLLIPSHDSTQSYIWIRFLFVEILDAYFISADAGKGTLGGEASGLCGKRRQTETDTAPGPPTGSGVSTKKEMLMRERLSLAVHFPVRQQNIQMKKFTQTGLTAREVSQLQKYAHDSVEGFDSMPALVSEWRS